VQFLATVDGARRPEGEQVATMLKAIRARRKIGHWQLSLERILHEVRQSCEKEH